MKEVLYLMQHAGVSAGLHAIFVESATFDDLLNFIDMSTFPNMVTLQPRMRARAQCCTDRVPTVVPACQRCIAKVDAFSRGLGSTSCQTSASIHCP